MRDGELWGFAVTFAIIAVITLLELKKWLPSGRAKFVIVFLAGAAAMTSLYLGGIPPDWFDGGRSAFLLAGTLILSGWVTQGSEGGTFGFPLMLGMGLTLIAVNVWAHV